MRCFFIMLTAIMLGAVNGRAQTTYHWKGAYTSYWHTATNWTGDAVPGVNDTANIGVAGGGVILQSPATVHSLVMSNDVTMIFTNWSTVLNAVNIDILSNAAVTCYGPFTDAVMSNRVNFAAQNFYLAAGAEINVNAKGFAGGYGVNGHGPGGGLYRGSGGGYGGTGGRGYDYLGGVTYGDKTAPIHPGSGGAASSGTQTGGHGGGAVRINASGSVVINGVISARGGISSYNQAGGGSGGGVYISCSTFTGTNGQILALGNRPSDAGGAGGYCGGGGGGRVAIIGASAPEYNRSVVLSAYPGRGGRNNFGEPGFPGSIYVSDVNILPTTWPSSSGGVLSAPESWTPENLTILSSILALDDEYSINVSNNVVFSSTNMVNMLNSRYYHHRPNGLYLQPNSRFSCGGNLTFDNVQIVINGSTNAGNTNMTTLSAGGNLDFINYSHTNFAQVYLFSNGTNDVFPEYDVLFESGGSAVLGTNLWVHSYSHITNGGSALFRLGSLTISSDSGFKADGGRENLNYGSAYWSYIGGYAGRLTGHGEGWGPGRGILVGVYGGGGYGGSGAPVGTAGGVTYGSSNAPVYPGSGGAANAGSGGPGNFGGGLVRIEVKNTLSMLQGSVISANGQSGTYNSHAGGSGGGIYLRSRELIAEAASFLSVTGGSSYSASSHAGGGGRIAAWSLSNTFAATTTVAPGTHDPSLSAAEQGTFVLGTFPYVQASITNFYMIVQSNRTEEASFEIWNARSGGDPAYYSFDSFNVPTLVFTPSNGTLSAQQTNTISVECVTGASHDGLYYGTLRILTTNSTMSDMEPYNIDIAAEIEVIPPPRGSFIMIK